jgi:hypothetical protein
MKLKHLQIVLFLILCCGHSQAQGCYIRYMKRGNLAKSNQHYDDAIKQYQAAKLCDSIGLREIQNADKLIDKAYQVWVQELNNAKILADRGNSILLLKEAVNDFITGDRIKAVSAISQKSFRRYPDVATFLSEITPFVPDMQMKGIISWYPYQFHSREYAVVIQTPDTVKKVAAKSLPRKGDKTVSDDESEESNVQNDSVRISIFDVSLRQWKKTFSIMVPFSASNHNDGFTINQKDDSLFFTSSKFIYRYQLSNNSFSKIGENNKVTNRLSDYSELDTMAVKKAFSSINKSVSFIKTTPLTGFSLVDISINDKAKDSAAYIIHDVRSAKYFNELGKLVVNSIRRSDTGYSLSVYDLPALKPVDSINNLLLLPSLTDASQNYLLLCSQNGNAGSKTPRRFIYNISNGSSFNLLNPDEHRYSISSIIKVDSGFTDETNTKFCLLDQKLNPLKCYSINPDERVSHVKSAHRVLIKTSVYPERSLAIVKKGDSPAATNKPEKLRVIDTDSGDSTIYTGKQIQLLSNSIVTVVKEASVEILNISLHEPRLAFLDNIHAIETGMIGNGFVFIKTTEQTRKNTDTSLLVFSLKKQEVVVRGHFLLSKEIDYAFLCQTADPNIQQLYLIDSTEAIVTKKDVPIAKNNAPTEEITYYPAKNLIYYVHEGGSGDDDENDDSEKDLLSSIFTGNGSAFVDAMVGQAKIIHLIYLSSGKKKSIGILSDQENNFSIIGNHFVVKESINAMDGGDQDPPDICYIYSIDEQSIKMPSAAQRNKSVKR